jgi:hypothetical protein
MRISKILQRWARLGMVSRSNFSAITRQSLRLYFDRRRFYYALAVRMIAAAAQSNDPSTGSLPVA